MFGANQLQLLLTSVLMYQVWGQPPADYDNDCRSRVTSGRDIVVVLDTGGYRQLFIGANSVWLERSFDSTDDPNMGHVSKMHWYMYKEEAFNNFSVNIIFA